MNGTRYLLTSILLFVAVRPGFAAPQVAADWPEATQLAKQSGKIRVVLLTGSDWDPVSRRAARMFQSPVFLAAVEDCVLLQIDQPDHPNEEQKALLEKNKDFKPTSYHFPALFAIDAEEQVIGSADGVTDEAQRWAAVVHGWLEQGAKRDALLARAEKAGGVAKDRLLGQALDELDYGIARGNGKWIDALKQADPKDSSGYVFKYTFDPYSLGEHGVAKVGNQPDKIRETLKQTESHLKNPVITTEQKQQLHAVRYGCYLRLPDSRVKAKDELEAIIALDAKSDTGHGAARLLELLNKELQFDQARVALEANPKDRQALAALLAVADSGNLEKLPPFAAPPGKLVEEPLELAFSSTSKQWGTPWKEALLTQAVYRGNFHTNADVRPWVTVKLPRAEAISGIAIFSSGPKERLVPLKVEVSLDGHEWKQVARHEQQFDQVIVDLSADSPRAQWVRVSRDDGRREFFHLSNVLIYSK